MAIAPVKKIRILAHSGVKTDILSSIQEQGLIHLEPSHSQELGLRIPSHEIPDMGHLLFRISHVIQYLSSRQKKGFIEKLSGKRPQLEIVKRMDALDWNYLSFLDQVEQLESEKNDILTQIGYLEREIEFLLQLQDLSLPVTYVKSTDFTEARMGIIPTSRLSELRSQTEQHPVYLSVIHSTKRNSLILLFFLKKESENLDRV